MSSWPDFSPTALLRALVAHGVDFVVVGGVAMIAHGSPRPTADLDICYAMEADNLEALGSVLVELGAKLRGIEEDIPFIPDARTLRRTVILTLSTRDGEIDLLVDPAGSPGYRRLKERADESQLAGLPVLIASLDDLESMKRAAGRPKDLLDLETIEKIRQLEKRDRP